MDVMAILTFNTGIRKLEGISICWVDDKGNPVSCKAVTTEANTSASEQEKYGEFVNCLVNCCEPFDHTSLIEPRPESCIVFQNTLSKHFTQQINFN